MTSYNKVIRKTIEIQRQMVSVLALIRMRRTML